jgi:polyphenol oxidase
MNVLRFNIFSEYKNIAHAVSTRDFGSMKNTDNTLNKENLKKFLTFLNLSSNAVAMNQVHGGNVAVIDDNSGSLIENTDGLVTSQKNVPLCVVTADCLPLIFYDPEKMAVGVAHAGRRGLAAGVISQTIEKFITKFNSNPKKILVGIGPGIEKKCYEVDGEFVDIRAMATADLIEKDIEEKNIENIDICTKCDTDNFFSYRGGDGTRRFATVIALI